LGTKNGGSTEEKRDESGWFRDGSKVIAKNKNGGRDTGDNRERPRIAWKEFFKEWCLQSAKTKKQERKATSC